MKNILLSSLVASLLVTSTFSKETTPKDTSVQQVNKIALNNAKKDINSHKAIVAQEAIESLKYAHEALMYLENDKKKKASQALEKALGKIEVILADKNTPKLLPVDNIITINEFIGTSETIEHMVKLAKKLLEEEKVQAARDVLMPLKSEMGITVINLPLVTYPTALKKTAQLIHDKKTEEAKIVLGTALNTLVKIETIVPIPLVKATDLVATAAVVVEKDTTKSKLYLAAAQEELKIAKSLGYLSKSDVTYQALDTAIDELKSEITSKEVKKLFTNLKTKIKDFTSKIFSHEEEKNKH